MIPRETIQKILEVAVQAPSGGQLPRVMSGSAELTVEDLSNEPWRFVVVSFIQRGIKMRR